MNQFCLARIRMYLIAFLTGIFCILTNDHSVIGEDTTKAEKNADSTIENPFPNRSPAPELDGGIEWLNSAGPISIKDLRGKIVLIDFWTFCCINCMHVLPDLSYLEKKFEKELVVIGVHSAKFDNEKDTGNIRKAILRYEIAHPVVNDAEMTIWRKFGVNSWPSLVVLDPEGQYCGYISGEGHRELLEKVVERLITFHEARGTLDRTPLHFELERSKSANSSLRFPGKLIIDERNQQLFISDSNHNRIVCCSLDGKLKYVIGSGRIGKLDGDFSTAQFDHPQGMALVDSILFVADTENHLIRRIDLNSLVVTTLAGTGEQNRSREQGGSLLKSAINSPWDLIVADNVLYIAMAGPHQLWSHRLGSDAIQPYAGSGREDIVDGELQQAAFAQPSGLARIEHDLFVVDSEGSAIRSVTTRPDSDLLEPIGQVQTIAGTHDLPRGRSLFEFGDVDAKGNEARFQHPLGITVNDGMLYIADSYNHKIRQIDLQSKEVTSWFGSGTAGENLEKGQLAEPAGIACYDGKMYVADTNNHRIVVIDMSTKAAREFVIEGLTAPELSNNDTKSSLRELSNVIKIEHQVLKPAKSISVEVELNLPDGFKLNPLFPISYQLDFEGNQSLLPTEISESRVSLTADRNRIAIQIPTKAEHGNAVLFLNIHYGYCRSETGGVCKVGSVTWTFPVTLRDDATQSSVQLKASAK